MYVFYSFLLLLFYLHMYRSGTALRSKLLRAGAVVSYERCSHSWHHNNATVVCCCLKCELVGNNQTCPPTLLFRHIYPFSSFSFIHSLRLLYFCLGSNKSTKATTRCQKHQQTSSYIYNHHTIALCLIEKLKFKRNMRS